MKCNKEKAMRAKEIAVKRMTAGDFSGAQKIARKAQQLFPALDNVTQLLTVCEVHCSAQNKILGKEMDWYTIFQIEPSADEMSVKKQYKRLALLLHPDKNKFPGAEAAFKLIREANGVLSDKAKRSVYDVKFKASVKNVAPKSQAQPSQRNTFRKRQEAGSNFHNGTHPQYGAANNVRKPSDSGTSRSSAKKREREPASDSSASYETRILLRRILDLIMHFIRTIRPEDHSTETEYIRLKLLLISMCLTVMQILLRTEYPNGQ